MRITQSYVHGASDVPLIGDTIGAYFDKAAARWGDRPALIVRQQEVRWSYGEFKERIDAFAAGLLALGIAPGDRVGIWSPNNAKWVVTQFATAKAGIILININPAPRLSRAPRVASVWADARASLRGRCRHRNAGITSLANQRSCSLNSLGGMPSAQWIMKCSSPGYFAAMDLMPSMTCLGGPQNHAFC